MRATAKAVYEQYQLDLEHEPGLWGVRLFDVKNRGGMVWRNAAHCADGMKMGFFPSPTIHWQGVEKYFTPARLAELKLIYAQAFQSGEPILRSIAFQSGTVICHEDLWFCAAFGDERHGVIVTQTFWRELVQLPTSA